MSEGGHMTQNLNTAEPPREQSSNRNLLITLVVVGVAIVALLLGILFFNLGKSDATPSDSPDVTTGDELTDSSDQGQDAGQGQGPGDGQGQGQGPGDGQGQGQGQGQGDVQVPELEPVDPQQKEIIEAQWRLDPDDPLAVGDVDADLLVQIYYDFRCGYCALAAVELEPQLQSFVDDGTIRVEYHNLPVLGEESMLAAQGSLAAANQGKFFDYHKYVFEQQYNETPVTFTDAGLADVAREIGVADVDQFTADMTSNEIVAEIQEDYTRGTQNLGITGTPAFIIGYSYVPGFIPYDTFIQVVDAELARPAA